MGMFEKVTLTAIALLFIVGGAYMLFGKPQGNTVSLTQEKLTTETNTVAETENQAGAQTTTTTTNTNKKIMNATLHTNKGDITIEFLPESAPNTVANFIKLAGAGYYDGTKFHRVIKGFMNQGGDPLTKDDTQKARWGTGGPGYQFADEIDAKLSNTKGMVSMANAGPNTNGSQFFINAADNKFLDGGYSIFGRVVAGMDIAMAINGVPTDSGDRPLEPVIISSITLNP